MFLFYSTHYPLPGKEELVAQNMRRFDELLKKQPGIIFASDIFKDTSNGTLLGFTFWESEEAFRAIWPIVVKDAPSNEWEVKPPDVFMSNSVA